MTEKQEPDIAEEEFDETNFRQSYIYDSSDEIYDSHREIYDSDAEIYDSNVVTNATTNKDTNKDLPNKKCSDDLVSLDEDEDTDSNLLTTPKENSKMSLADESTSKDMHSPQTCSGDLVSSDEAKDPDDINFHLLFEEEETMRPIALPWMTSPLMIR